MQYRILGRTGLRVSLISLGSGGPNRFGQKRFLSETRIVRLIHSAIDLDINFFDTSSIYGKSEEILGRALRGIPRDNYFLASKFLPEKNGVIAKPEEVTSVIENSLRRLNVDMIDLMQFHRVTPQVYRTVVDRLMPAITKLQKKGKIRFVGITESTLMDPNHEMLYMALTDDIFDTIMVSYSLINPSYERNLFSLAHRKNTGVICMVAARELSRNAKLLKKISELKSFNLIARDYLIKKGQLSWRINARDTSLAMAFGYKFAATNSSIATVLTGTTNIEHLEDNVQLVLSYPLTDDDMFSLRSIFGHDSGYKVA